ncbi:MAG: hypothetical protein PHR78_01670 [Eubacteriales bacterium]|nr:hypothetical protein [Eubacteriales bacterium]MDD4324280.1 hypothetical protein [Eubacteriales bacterium]MDD4540864.1 hypothetical protein [Eubacteriales bacterium]
MKSKKSKRILAVMSALALVLVFSVVAVSAQSLPKNGASFGKQQASQDETVGRGGYQGAMFGEGEGAGLNTEAPNFADEDGDGVCDNYASRPMDGTGYGAKNGGGYGGNGTGMNTEAPNFVDEDEDGVCDNFANRPMDGTGYGAKNGGGYGGYGTGMNTEAPNFADEDGDGLNDNYADADDDGVCDNFATRVRPQDGTGNGGRR